MLTLQDIFKYIGFTRLTIHQKKSAFWEWIYRAGGVGGWGNAHVDVIPSQCVIYHVMCYHQNVLF